MGKTESVPPACEYASSWQFDTQAAPSPTETGSGAAAASRPPWLSQPSSSAAAATGSHLDWRLLELSDADGNVFDLSFVFDQNWWVEPSRLPSLTDAPPAAAVSRRDCGAGVMQDTFELHHVLSRSECDDIVGLSDAIGFQRPTCGGGIGSKEATPPPDRLVWVTDLAWCDQVYRRMKRCLPASINGRQPVGINPRWRLYRYEPGFALERHQDRSFKPSGADEAGELRYDVLRDGSESLLTLLIYLNEGMQGGGTMVYERDDAASALEEVSPQPGSALLFPHGRENPDSVWHAGMPVICGIKYIIRTDVIYGPGPASSVDAATDDVADTPSEAEAGAGASPVGTTAAAAWDDATPRSVFRQIDEDEIGWMDAAGMQAGIKECGYVISGETVAGLLGTMADEREDIDYINVDEFCRLCHMVHDEAARAI